MTAPLPHDLSPSLRRNDGDRAQYQEEVKKQIEIRKVEKEKEAEEILRLEKEWLARLEKEDKSRHAAFDKIVAKQVGEGWQPNE